MEDRDVVMPFLNELAGFGESEPRISLFGVFDGHGGRDTADYVATYLPYNLMQAYEKSKDVKKGLILCFDPHLNLFDWEPEPMCSQCSF